MSSRWRILLAAFLFAAVGVHAETADPASAAALSPALPDPGASIFRVCGAFAFVVALFLGGVWLYKNWQRFAVKKGRGARLCLIEARSLGQRQAIYVVGYQQQRMLIASSPAGVTFLSHLPSAEDGEQETAPANPSFTEALQHVLSRRQ